MNSSCIVRYNGIIYRIPKSQFETEERAQDRAWYIAKKINDMMPTDLNKINYDILLNESHIYANKKYFDMDY